MRTQALAERCRQSLLKNRLNTPTGHVFPAGHQQFGSLWVRDFCHAVPGLIKANELESVEHQLSYFLKFQREDGLIPRGLDVVSPKIRVLTALVQAQWLTKNYFQYTVKPIRPEYLGEHLTPAFDSNILVALAFEQLRSLSPVFYSEAQPALDKALSYYKSFYKDGLFHQPLYSDWLDSLKRSGPQLYFHILLLKYLKQSGKKLSWLPSHFSQTVFDHFLAEGKWQNESTEALLWIVADPSLCGELDTEAVWNHLKERGWGVPLPLQKWRDVSWTNKFVGLRKYHDGFRWSWLLGETLKIAKKMDRPEVSEIEHLTAELVLNSGMVSEIYETDEHREVKTWLYKSEKPFTWGAAKILEALTSN